MSTIVIAHKLTKQVGVANEPELQLRSTVNPSDTPPVEQLVAKARKGVSQSSSIGRFQKEADGEGKVFERLVIQFSELETDQAFVDFSRAAMSALQERIRGKAAATGGYVIFIYYTADNGEQAGQKFLVVALVTDHDIPAFDENMNVIDSTVLDLEKLKHGARVRMSSLTNNADGVISLLPSKSTREPAGYFTEFIGSSEFTDSAMMAAKLDQRLDEWFENQQLDSAQITDLKFRVYGHWKDHGGAKEGIIISSLGNTLYPDDNQAFVDFMTDENNGVPGIMPPIRSNHMSRFRKFSHSSSGLKLEYDTGGAHNWSGKVRVDGERVIIEDAPESLRTKIENDG